MTGWKIRADMEEIDVAEVYGGHPTIFSIKLFYGGNFTNFPGREYVNGKLKYIDLVDIDTFSVHDIDDIMLQLDCVEEGKLLFYHFKIPYSDLDIGLYALASDADINHLSKYVANHKLIEVYTEHGKTMLHTYYVSPNPIRVRIEEFSEPPRRRLALKWKESETGDCSSVHTKKVTSNEAYQAANIQPCQEFQFSDYLNDQFSDYFNDEVQPPIDQVQVQTPPIDQVQVQTPPIVVADDNMIDEPEPTTDEDNESDESDDSDFVVDEDNMIDEPDVDMRDFFKHIDKDVEWMGVHEGSHRKEECSRDIGELEVLNHDALPSGSSSDEGESKNRKKSIKAIRRAEEKKEARVGDPFYVYQTFASAKEVKQKIRKHAVESRREIEIIKNDKNRVRAVCKGSIPELGEADADGQGKCPWVLYASKWKEGADWEVKTYVKEHRCLQTRSVKACTYKFLSQEIVQQIESNPTVPTRALQEQLQREYQVDLSKMKVFRAKTEAMNHVRGDYAGQYAILRDYIFELQSHNPDTTVKIEVECEPNPSSETRTFKRIYVCLGPLKKGFLAGKRDYLGLDGSFMKGPYPGMILTAVGLDGNSCTYPLAYAVVESENINSWTWFLNCLGDDIDLHRNSNFTFVTDRQKGLLQAISTLFPCAEHRFCLRHIQENMKVKWKGKVFKDALWKCATVTTVQEFNHAMDEFRKLNNDCYQWVKAIPPLHWARSHFTGRAHCDGLLNNLCETINNQLQDARDQPIITCLEFIREYLMLRIVNVEKEIDKASGPLTPTATTILEKNKIDAAQCKGVFCGNGKYQVTGPWMDQCVVDMEKNTCSCRKWELTGIPCKHALVAIWDMRKNKQQVGLPESWVHPTYWLKTWKEMYSFKIEPINGRRMWQKYPCPTTLLPPKHHVPIGRPKKKRRKSAVELEDMVKGGRAARKEKSLTCSKCNNVGHNKRSCKGQVNGGPSGARDGARRKGKKVV